MRAQGLTKVKITQPSESLSYMPIYLGRAKEFFKEAGIDLTGRHHPRRRPGRAGADGARRSSSSRRRRTTSTRCIFRTASCSASAAFSAAAESTWWSPRRLPRERGVSEDSPFEKKLAALKGLTFGVSTPGSLTYNMGLYYILRAGLKPQVDAKVVGTGVGTAALAAMSNKIANASMFPSPTADEAVHRGFATWLINNTRGQDPDLKEFLHAVVYVRPDYLSENTDLCKRMIGAMVKSAAWIKSNPVERGRQGDAAVLRVARRSSLSSALATCGRL